MGGKATLVARVLEAVRQRDLTNRLGQVTCLSSRHVLACTFWDCPDCGAAV